MARLAERCLQRQSCRAEVLSDSMLGVALPSRHHGFDFGLQTPKGRKFNLTIPRGGHSFGALGGIYFLHPPRNLGWLRTSIRFASAREESQTTRSSEMNPLSQANSAKDLNRR